MHSHNTANLTSFIYFTLFIILIQALDHSSFDGFFFKCFSPTVVAMLKVRFIFVCHLVIRVCVYYFSHFLFTLLLLYVGLHVYHSDPVNGIHPVGASNKLINK